jgi:hypothetical protein
VSDFDVSSEDVEKAFPGYGDNDDTDEEGIPGNDSWELARLLNIVSSRGLDAIESDDIADVGLTPAQFEKFADQIGASKVYNDSQKPPAAEVDDGEKISAAKEPENKPAADSGKSIPTKPPEPPGPTKDEKAIKEAKDALVVQQDGYMSYLDGMDKTLTAAMAEPIKPDKGAETSIEYPEGIYSSGKPCIVFYPGWGGSGGGEGDTTKAMKKSIGNFLKANSTAALAALKGTVGDDIAKAAADGAKLMAEGAAAALKLAETPASTRTMMGAVVALYMPEGIEFSHSADWASEDGGVIRQGMRGGADVSDVKDRAKQGIMELMQTGVGKDWMARKGKAKKNLRSVMFNGVGFRRFSMAWTFVPKSTSEANSVAVIISSFNEVMHPETDKVSTTYWVLPGFYDIETRGVNDVGKFMSSVLTDIKVTYGNDGRMNVLPDGSPSAITLSLTFTELKQRSASNF